MNNVVTSKPAYTPPLIEHEFVDDNGELNYALKNGNTTLADKYNAIWHPTRSKVNWKAKAPNPDRTKIV